MTACPPLVRGGHIFMGLEGLILESHSQNRQVSNKFPAWLRTRVFSLPSNADHKKNSLWCWSVVSWLQGQAVTAALMTLKMLMALQLADKSCYSNHALKLL